MKQTSIIKRMKSQALLLFASLIFCGISYESIGQEVVTVAQLKKKGSSSTEYKVVDLTFIAPNISSIAFYGQDSTGECLEMSKSGTVNVFEGLEEGDVFDIVTYYKYGAKVIDVTKKGRKADIIIKELTLKEAIAYTASYDGDMVRIKNVDYEYISYSSGKIKNEDGEMELRDWLLNPFPNTPMQNINMVGILFKISSTVKKIAPRSLSDFEVIPTYGTIAFGENTPNFTPITEWVTENTTINPVAGSDNEPFKNIAISTANITETLTVSISPENAAFKMGNGANTIDTSLPEQATGAEFKITFHPTTYGTFSNELVVTGASGHEYGRLPLEGTCKETISEIETVTIAQLLEKPSSTTTQYELKNLTYVASNTSGTYHYAQDQDADILTMGKEISVEGVFSTLEEGDVFDMITIWNDEDAIVQSVTKKGSKADVIIKDLTMAEAVANMSKYDGKMVRILNVSYEYISNKYVGKITDESGSLEVWDMLMPLSESLPKTQKTVNITGLLVDFGSMAKLIAPRHVTDIEEVAPHAGSTITSTLIETVPMGVFTEFELSLIVGEATYSGLEIDIATEKGETLTLEYFNEKFNTWETKDLSLGSATIRSLEFKTQTIRCRIEPKETGSNKITFTAIGVRESGTDKIPEAEATSTYTVLAGTPNIGTSIDNIAFTAVLGVSVPTQTITVTAENLAADMTVTIEGLNSTSFSYTKSSWDVRTGGIITVKYSPLLVGTHTANILITSGTIIKTVSISAVTSAFVEPEITLSTASLNFVTTVNVPSESNTLTVTAVSLTEDLRVTIEGTDAAMFTHTLVNWTATTGGTVNVIYTPTNEGKHKASLKVRSGTITKSVTLNGEAKNVGIDELMNKITFHPNPARNILNINGDYQFLEIYNSSGRLALKASGETQLNISHLPEGVYIIKTYNLDKISTSKIVIVD